MGGLTGDWQPRMVCPFGQTWRKSCLQCWGFRQVTLSPSHHAASCFHNKAPEHLLKYNLSTPSYLLSKQRSHCVGAVWVTLIWKGWARRASDLGPFQIRKHLYTHNEMCVGRDPSLNLNVFRHTSHTEPTSFPSPLSVHLHLSWDLS